MGDFIDRLGSLTTRPACFEHLPVDRVRCHRLLAALSLLASAAQVYDKHCTLWLLRFVASALVRLDLSDDRLSLADADSLVYWAQDSVARLYVHAGARSHGFDSVDLRLLGTVEGFLTGDPKADQDIAAMVPNNTAWTRSIAVSEGAGPSLLHALNGVLPDSPHQLHNSFATGESRHPGCQPLLPRPLPLTDANNVDHAVLVTDWAPAPGYDSAASTAVRKRLEHTFSPALNKLKRSSKERKVDIDVDVRELGSHQRGAAATVTLDYLVVFNGESPALADEMPPDVTECHAALARDRHARHLEYVYKFDDLGNDLQLSRHTLIAPDEGIRYSVITFRWYALPDDDEDQAEPVNQHYVRVNVFYSWKDTAGAAEYCLTSSPVALESFCLHLAEKRPELQLSSAGLCKIDNKGKVTLLKTKDEFELFSRCNVMIWQSELALTTPDLPFVPYLTLDGRYIPASAFSIDGWVFGDADELMDIKPLSVPLFAPTPSSTPQDQTPQDTTPKTGSKRDAPPSSSSGSVTPAAPSHAPPSIKSRSSTNAGSTASKKKKKTSDAKKKKPRRDEQQQTHSQPPMDIDDQANDADNEQGSVDSPSTGPAAALPSPPSASAPQPVLRPAFSFPRLPADAPPVSPPIVPPGVADPVPPVAPPPPSWARRLKDKFPRARLPSFGVGSSRRLSNRTSFPV